ncbi:hypothetical protein T484DRAFT_1837645 [Baffinella frigidus]|nr:hypothetical protein T484DRAFT_1837645 [Cryptophyta sp. CCMP2293]
MSFSICHLPGALSFPLASLRKRAADVEAACAGKERVFRAAAIEAACAGKERVFVLCRRGIFSRSAVRVEG